MVIHVPPDFTGEGSCPIDQMGWPSLMIHGKGRDIYYPRHVGPLSIKTVTYGSETFEVNNLPYQVTPDSYLILNDRQEYASYIQSKTVSTSFSIFFAPSLANEVLSGLLQHDSKLLDNPNHFSSLPVHFVEKLYQHDQLLSPMVDSIRCLTKLGPVSEGWLEEHYRLLLEQMLVVHRNVEVEIERLPAARHATRVELYRRLHRAKDFMDSTLSESISLDHIARVACLSPHHLLRTFKETFCTTPHKYISIRRLEQAKILLQRTECSVTDICEEVGFHSLGTFSRVFKARFGLSPTQYRKVRS